MKSRETLIRLKKFQVDEKRRRVSQIEGMIADFQRMSVDLEREIQTEQERAGINDPSHFAYPTYAKAAIQRRENLTRSADELRIQLEDARSMLAEAFEELYYLERAAKTLVLAYSTGQPLNILSDAVAEKTALCWEEYRESAFAHFRDLKSMLDAKDASYRD